MRAIVLVLALALLAPMAGALRPAPASTPAATARDAPGDPGGPGCVAQPDGATCLWIFNDSDKLASPDPARLGQGNPASPFYALPLASNATYARTYATVTVNFDGQDNGWGLRFHAANATAARDISDGGHSPDDPTTPAHLSRSAHVLFVDPGWNLWLYVFTSYSDAAAHSTNTTPASLGTWRVVVHTEPLPQGQTPSRPAATRADPQLLMGALEAAEPDRDLRAAWLDDESLGDGLFEARLQVASLDHVDFNTTRDFGAGTDLLEWTLSFRVKAITYNMTWHAYANGAAQPDWGCDLYLADSNGPGNAPQKVASPWCEVDVPNATFLARIPERSVGSPTPADLFLNLKAASLSYPGSDALNRPQSGTGDFEHFFHPIPDAEDQSRPEDMRYAFALGGPDVWHALNPRLDPPLQTIPPWYVAPLAEENIPNTLQVAGAIAAVVTFLAGALAVLARRRQIRRHLDRIDAVERAPSFGSPDTLRELGALEDEFARLFRRGRLTEAQFQVLSQRIASVATRFAMRRELGLVERAPPEGAVRVPIRDADTGR